MTATPIDATMSGLSGSNLVGGRMLAKHCRALAAVITALWLVSGWADTSTAAEQRAFGLIEIGGSGIKAVVVEFSSAGGASEGSALDLKILRRFPIQNVDAAFPENQTKVAAAVEALAHDLQARYGLDPLHIYITADSGLNVEKQGAALRMAIDEAVAGRAGALSFISRQEQARFGFNGVVNCPRLAHRRQQTVFIDVGSSEIVAAAAGPRLGACGTEAISAISFGFGVKTAPLMLAASAPTAEAARAPLTIDAMIAHALEKDPVGTLRRNRVYLGGGIVWTLATMLHPANGTSYVRLQAGDFARMRAQLQADASCLTDPTMALRADRECTIVDVDYSAVPDPDQRVRVAADHREIVTSIYSREQLVAGTDILLSLVKQLELENAEFFFARPSLNAWMMGYLLAQEAGPGAPARADAGQR